MDASENRATDFKNCYNLRFQTLEAVSDQQHITKDELANRISLWKAKVHKDNPFWLRVLRFWRAFREPDDLNASVSYLWSFERTLMDHASEETQKQRDNQDALRFWLNLMDGPERHCLFAKIQFAKAPAQQGHDMLVNLAREFAVFSVLLNDHAYNRFTASLGEHKLTLHKKVQILLNLLPQMGTVSRIYGEWYERTTFLASVLSNTRRYAVAFSFPGDPWRDQIECLVDALKRQPELENKEVFYDRHLEGLLATRKLKDDLGRYFGEHAELVVVALCGEYWASETCREVEWPSIYSRYESTALQASVILLHMDREYLLSDDAEAPHTVKSCLTDDYGRIECSVYTPGEIARLIVQRYKGNQRPDW